MDNQAEEQARKNQEATRQGTAASSPLESLKQQYSGDEAKRELIDQLSDKISQATTQWKQRIKFETAETEVLPATPLSSEELDLIREAVELELSDYYKDDKPKPHFAPDNLIIDIQPSNESEEEDNTRFENERKSLQKFANQVEQTLPKFTQDVLKANPQLRDHILPLLFEPQAQAAISQWDQVARVTEDFKKAQEDYRNLVRIITELTNNGLFVIIDETGKSINILTTEFVDNLTPLLEARDRGQALLQSNYELIYAFIELFQAYNNELVPDDFTEETEKITKTFQTILQELLKNNENDILTNHAATLRRLNDKILQSVIDKKPLQPFFDYSKGEGLQQIACPDINIPEDIDQDTEAKIAEGKQRIQEQLRNSQRAYIEGSIATEVFTINKKAEQRIEEIEQVTATKLEPIQQLENYFSDPDSSRFSTYSDQSEEQIAPKIKEYTDRKGQKRTVEVRPLRISDPLQRMYEEGQTIPTSIINIRDELMEIESLQRDAKSEISAITAEFSKINDISSDVGAEMNSLYGKAIANIYTTSEVGADQLLNTKQIFETTIQNIDTLFESKLPGIFSVKKRKAELYAFHLQTKDNIISHIDAQIALLNNKIRLKKDLEKKQEEFTKQTQQFKKTFPDQEINTSPEFWSSKIDPIVNEKDDRIIEIQTTRINTITELKSKSSNLRLERLLLDPTNRIELTSQYQQIQYTMQSSYNIILNLADLVREKHLTPDSPLYILVGDTAYLLDGTTEITKIARLLEATTPGLSPSTLINFTNFPLPETVWQFSPHLIQAIQANEGGYRTWYRVPDGYTQSAEITTLNEYNLTDTADYQNICNTTSTLKIPVYSTPAHYL